MSCRNVPRETDTDDLEDGLEDEKDEVKEGGMA
jgi:hypothetical protein